MKSTNQSNKIPFKTIRDFGREYLQTPYTRGIELFDWLRDEQIERPWELINKRNSGKYLIEIHTSCYRLSQRMKIIRKKNQCFGYFHFFKEPMLNCFLLLFTSSQNTCAIKKSLGVTEEDFSEELEKSKREGKEYFRITAPSKERLWKFNGLEEQDFQSEEMNEMEEPEESFFTFSTPDKETELTKLFKKITRGSYNRVEKIYKLIKLREGDIKQKDIQTKEYARKQLRQEMEEPTFNLENVMKSWLETYKEDGKKLLESYRELMKCCPRENLMRKLWLKEGSKASRVTVIEINMRTWMKTGIYNTNRSLTSENEIEKLKGMTKEKMKQVMPQQMKIAEIIGEILEEYYEKWIEKTPDRWAEKLVEFINERKIDQQNVNKMMVMYGSTGCGKTMLSRTIKKTWRFLSPTYSGPKVNNLTRSREEFYSYISIRDEFKPEETGSGKQNCPLVEFNNIIARNIRMGREMNEMEAETPTEKDFIFMWCTKRRNIKIEDYEEISRACKEYRERSMEAYEDQKEQGKRRLSFLCLNTPEYAKIMKLIKQVGSLGRVVYRKMKEEVEDKYKHVRNEIRSKIGEEHQERILTRIKNDQKREEKLLKKRLSAMFGYQEEEEQILRKRTRKEKTEVERIIEKQFKMMLKDVRSIMNSAEDLLRNELWKCTIIPEFDEEQQKIDIKRIMEDLGNQIN